MTDSPGRPSGSRDVASTVSWETAPRSRSRSREHAWRRCSQLSRTSDTRRDPQMLDDHIEEGGAPVSSDTEDGSNRSRNQFLVFDRSEVDDPDAVAVGACNTPGNFDREAGLARAPGADQRDESVLVELLLELANLVVAPDELDGGDGGCGARWVVCRGRGRSGGSAPRAGLSRGWFDAQFLDEQAAQLLIRAQRLRRTARSIQREHPSACQSRSRSGCSASIASIWAVGVRSGGPRCEHRLEPVLAAAQSFLAEPRLFDFERRHIVTESFERSPPPKPKRLIDPLDRGNRVEREQTAPTSEALREPLRVQFVGFEHENIPIAAPDNLAPHRALCASAIRACTSTAERYQEQDRPTAPTSDDPIARPPQARLPRLQGEPSRGRGPTSSRTSPCHASIGPSTRTSTICQRTDRVDLSNYAVRFQGLFDVVSESSPRSTAAGAAAVSWTCLEFSLTTSPHHTDETSEQEDCDELHR